MHIDVMNDYLLKYAIQHNYSFVSLRLIQDNDPTNGIYKYNKLSKRK